MPKIIFITGLTLWSMGKGHGGPAFTQTVRKYIDEGWEVYLISDEPTNRDYPELDSAHNIFLPPTPFKKYGQIRKLGLLFRWLDHKSMTRRFCAATAPLLSVGVEDTVLYAYEIFGVEACRRLAERYHVPVVTRFQGTFCLYQYLPDITFGPKIRRYPQCQAIAQSSDLVIITDDGTRGNEVLKALHNPSTSLFLKNGLELMEKDITVLYAEFDRAAFRTSLGLGSSETVFLTVSRLVGSKRVERAIEGFADFIRRGGSGKLVIVGDGDAKPALERRAEELSVGGHVIFTGAVPHSEVYGYMMMADIFLSLYDISNVGNPLLEAMTLGKCVVTLDVGDTRSLIHDQENGILLTMDTLPRLGEVLLKLSEVAGERERLGQAAAHYAREHFQTWEQRMDTEYEAVRGLLTKGEKR